jgi:hypothetical protein
MKTVFAMLVGIGISAAAIAQVPASEQKKKAEINDLKEDVKAKKEQKKEVTKAWTHGHVKKAVQEHQEKKEIKEDIKHDEATLKAQGVKHPVAKAKHKLKAEKEAQKAKPE